MNIILDQNRDEFAEFLVQSTEEFLKEYCNPTAICISLLASSKTILISFNYQKNIDKSDLTPNQFEVQNYRTTKYEFGEPNKYGLVYDMRLWTGVRNATTKINLPTVLCCFENSTENYLALETEMEIFGRSVVQYFRDENIELYNWYIDRFTKRTMMEIENEIPKHWAKELRQKHIRDAKFFNNLNEDQITFLNYFVKMLIDSTAMNVMRAIDENTGNENDFIEIKINNISATKLPMIGNGNLSGEYLDWCERFSKFGPNVFTE